MFADKVIQTLTESDKIFSSILILMGQKKKNWQLLKKPA